MGEKTEAPTPRRRDEARAKGQGVGRSAEFSMGLTLGVGTLALSSLLPGIARNLVERTQNAVVNLNPHATQAEMMGAAGDAVLSMVTLVLPLAGLVMIAGIAGNLVSGGLVFSSKAVRFDFSRMNPISGMKRIADKQALVRLGIASAKLAVLALVSYQIVGSRIPAIVNSQGASATEIAGTCLSSIFQLGLTIVILLAVIALVDFVVQRRKAMESIKMTKEEVKQEYRESEGDPQVRGARRRRARQLAFARMMDAVPTADVIVTNPTTLAVALKYDSLTMRAPKIVAKGQRLMAERIKAIAREHRVPVIEDKPLARALFTRPIGSEVPGHLYRAVARLLVVVHQARFARQGAGRGGRPWTADQARAAGGGLNTQPWWTSSDRGSGAGAGQATGTGTGALGGEVIARQSDVDGATAAQLYGRIGGATQAADALVNATLQEEEEWIAAEADDGTRLQPDAVDEAALAAAMAADELKDLTPEEIAAYEAEIALDEAGNLLAEIGDDTDETDDTDAPESSANVARPTRPTQRSRRTQTQDNPSADRRADDEEPAR